MYLKMLKIANDIMKKRNILSLSSRKGFTYVESIVSVMVISVIALHMAFIVPASYLLIKQTDDVQKATDLAQKYFEAVKSDLSYRSKYDLVQAGTAPIEVTNDFTNNDYFVVNANVTDLENEVIESQNVVTLKQIDVSYKKTGSESTLVSLSTVISRPGK